MPHPAEHDAARARATAGAGGQGCIESSLAMWVHNVVDRSKREGAMRTFWAALALAGVGCVATGTAEAEPVKIAIIETLSGGQAAVGKMFLTAINYGLIKLNNEKVWPDGIKILEYDNQGGPSEAADKMKAAINDGAHIIIQGASSAIGGPDSPYVAKIKEANPDTVITGNWSSDLLLLMKAAGDSGLKVRFATYWMDQPGNVANAGATAIGHYNVSSYYPEANGDATAKFADDFKAKMGQYPVFIQGHTVHGIWGLGEALKKMKPGADGKVNVKQLAFAMETVSFNTSMGEVAMRKEDHQALLPLVVATVSKEAKYKVDGTDMGFKPVRLVSGKDAASPVQASCKMERPGS